MDVFVFCCVAPVSENTISLSSSASNTSCTVSSLQQSLSLLQLYVASVSRLDETSGMDSDLEEDGEETGEPLAKREKSEHEVIQVIQVGALEDGSHPVVGVVQQSVLHSLPQPPQDHSDHILTPATATPTIRHCSATGNTYASV